MTHQADCACPLCETFATNDSGYFHSAFGDARRREATSAALVESFGFCARHGSDLLAQAHSLHGIAPVFREVLPHLTPLLAEEFLHEERVQQILFGASEACPACANDHRAVARHAARVAKQYANLPLAAGQSMFEGFCVEHFRVVAGELRAEHRIAAVTQYIEALETAASALEMHASAGSSPGPVPPGRRQAELYRGIALVAGRPTSVGIGDTLGIAHARERYPNFADSLACTDICPFCLEVDRARHRWLHVVQAAAKHDLDGWLLFPTCPEHLWAAAELGDLNLTGAVVAHAQRVAIEYFHRQLLALVRAAESAAELAAARVARWSRRRRRKKPAGPRPTAPRPTMCPGCERLFVAEAHAGVRLIDLLHAKKHRDAFEHGYGLCMKHFAQVYLIAPKGVIRSTLLLDQDRRLVEFKQQLETIRQSPPEDLRMQGTPAPWAPGLRRFRGGI